jgi:hypothetical protein
LLIAVVGSRENVARMESVRKSNLAMAGMDDGPVLSDAPAIVWLSYGVHGNESVSTEAALRTLYELADAGNARAQGWLANTVVLIDPCINPDGRDRYVDWYNRVVGRFPAANPDDWTHHEPWPGGRTNHYYYDLNRDWAWASQQETQRRLALYNDWMPHVHVDFHEQGINAPYYFAPAAEPFHEAITPWQREFQTTIGENHARYFDQNNWLYFTRETFDLLYPGYGDTWPTYNGAIGMTYEQAGGGGAGLAVVTAERDTLTLADRIEHHYTTGMSTIEVSSRDASRLLREFRAFFDAAQSDQGRGARAYVIRTRGDEDNARSLASLLDLQGITYGFASNAGVVRGFKYSDGEQGSFSVETGDLVIRAAQPKATLLKVLFEPQASLSDSLTYDITAWALPYLFDLEAVAATQNVAATSAPPWRTTIGDSADRPYAYLAAAESFADHQFLASLLTKNVSVRVATRAFAVANTDYPRGTIVITRTGNEPLGTAFDDIVRKTAVDHEQSLAPVTSGFVTRGPDFGSSAVAYLAKPVIGVVGGSEVSSYSLGSLWHYFDRQLGYPVNILPTSSLGRVRWSDYDVVVLPSGSYNDVLREGVLDEIKTWTRGGGRLIALERAASFLSGKDGFDLKQRQAKTDTSTSNPAEQSYGDRRRRSISEDIPGAIYKARLDPTHPLAYGFRETLPVLRRSTSAFEPLKGPSNWNVGIIESGSPVSGFAGHETREVVDGSLFVGVQRMGRGSVVYFADDPLFRGLWHAGKQLFGNAVFFVGVD